VGKKLYVRNLSAQVDSSVLENMFNSVADVESAVVSQVADKPGWFVGHVEMVTEEGARDCIDRFNGKEKNGLVLIVTEDVPHVPKPNFSVKKRPVVTPAKNHAKSHAKSHMRSHAKSQV
jgi:hypothetical protein